MDIVNFIVEQVEHDKHRALYECKEEAERILKEIDSIMINKAE
jgi:predicted transcriptional regulator